MPLLESPEGRSDGGYAVSDFRRVQPELGTMDDLSALAADCHQRGIALCLDFVMNHTSGDELAQENDYGYHDDPLKAEDSRWLHRGDMNWTRAEKRGDETSPEGQVFQGLRRLERKRAAHRVFDGNADVWLVDTGDDGVLGIGRYYEGEKLIALFNFAAAEKLVSLDELGDNRDLLSGDALDKTRVRIPSGGFVWMLCDFTKG